MGARKNFLVTKTVRHGRSSFRRHRGGQSVFTNSTARSCPPHISNSGRSPRSSILLAGVRIEAAGVILRQ